MDTSNSDLIQEFKTSGKTQNEFCKEKNISLEKLRYHLYKKVRLNRKKPGDITAPAQASFITFAQNPGISQRPGSQCYTIIHGQFTVEALSSLLKMVH